MQRRSAMELFALTLTLGFSGHTPIATAAAPALWLANRYRDGLDLSRYWVSEKYDGVRVLWNGQALLTRGGHTLSSPDWFHADWPRTPFEGELWAGREQFSSVASVIQQSQPRDEDWQKLRIMVFDAPSHPGNLSQRIQAYGELVKSINQPWVQAVAQQKIDNPRDLKQLHLERTKLGAEGLMLRLANATYRSGRSDDHLKLKSHQDNDAQVIAHIAGTGKFANLLGALQVQTAQGQRFKIGSGLREEDRRSPPAVGEWITYRYRGLTEQGIPRFATYLRVNPDYAQQP